MTSLGDHEGRSCEEAGFNGLLYMKIDGRYILDILQRLIDAENYSINEKSHLQLFSFF